MTYTFRGVFNVLLFTEELVAAFPMLVKESVALFTLNYDGATMTLWTAVRLDETALRRLVTDHDPRGDSKSVVRRKRAEALKGSIEGKLLALGFTAEELVHLADFLDASRRA